MDVSLDDSIVIRAIFKGRELFLGSAAGHATHRRSLLEMTKELGWVVLASVPNREIVMGAATRPWESDVVFRGVPTQEFADFDEPGYVKIVWTLRADASGPGRSIARTETRAVATDADARRKFRWYWARFSPGIVVIREIAQQLVKESAERRAQSAAGRATEILVPPASGKSI